MISSESSEIDNIRIYCFSDIHLEYQYSSVNLLEKNIEKILPPVLDPLIQKKSIALLCGDIGYPGSEVYRHFLQECSIRFEEVYVIAGNHEYYNLRFSSPDLSFSCSSSNLRSMREVERQMREDCRDTTCIYLQDTTYDSKLGDFRLIGSTLWHPIQTSNCPFDNYQHRDYIYIPSFNAKLCQKLNRRDSRFIQEEIERSRKVCIVMTHHPAHPLLCEPSHSPSTYQYTSSDYLERYDHVPFWFSGHTHYSRWINSADSNCQFPNSHTIVCGSTTYLSNSLGRPTEDTGYSPTRYIELKARLET